jgi:general stress protein YciG
MATNDKGNKQSGDTSKRGFASMDPEQQREIAAQGGRAAHQKGTAHEFTSEEARKAGSMSHKNDRNRQSAAEGSAGKANPASNGEQNADQGDCNRGGRGSGAGPSKTQP